MAIGCAMAVQAQKAPVFETSAKEEIMANRFLAGSNYLDYDRQLPTKALTPTPKGYEPYYMSHYGRHGSRWLISDGNYSRPIATLETAKEMGKLTAKGEEVLETLKAIYKTSTKRLGDLTTVGERQHHGIGKRMTQNFPEIFKKSQPHGPHPQRREREPAVLPEPALGGYREGDGAQHGRQGRP